MKPRIRKLWFGKYVCYGSDPSTNGFGDTPEEAYNEHIKWNKYMQVYEDEGTLLDYFERTRESSWFSKFSAWTKQWWI